MRRRTEHCLTSITEIKKLWQACTTPPCAQLCILIFALRGCQCVGSFILQDLFQVSKHFLPRNKIRNFPWTRRRGGNSLHRALFCFDLSSLLSSLALTCDKQYLLVGAGLEKTPVRSSGTSRFSLWASNFFLSLARRARTQAICSRLNFWQRFLGEKVSFRLKGNQVFRWSLKKITIYSAVLFIAWRALTALKWLPCTWSKSAQITCKFLSRIKKAVLGTKMLCLFLYFSNFLRAFFSFSVQNLTQQRYITKQHF